MIQPQIAQNFQLQPDRIRVAAVMCRRVHSHVYQLHQGSFLAVPVGVTDQLFLFPIARPAALRTGNVNIRKNLNIERDRSGSVADQAAQTPRVVKSPALQTSRFAYAVLP